MDYSQLSDFEINAMVHFGNKPQFRIINGYASFLNENGITTGFGQFYYKNHFPDYCNNWSDGGPIIESKLICLAADVFAESHDGGKWVAQPAYGWDSERVRSDKPLRAAMILFLKMQESK